MTGAICSMSEGPDHRALLHHYLLLLIEIISHSGMHMFALHFPTLAKRRTNERPSLAPSFIHYVCSLQKIPFQKTCVDLRCAGTSRAVSPSSAMRIIDTRIIFNIIFTHKYGVV